MADDADDLSELQRLIRRAPVGDVDPMCHELGEDAIVLPLVGDDDAHDDDEVVELQHLQDLAVPVPSPRRFERRSADLMMHARRCKNEKQLEQRTQIAERKEARAKRHLELVHCQHHGVVPNLRLVALSTDDQAEVRMQVACSPRPKHSSTFSGKSHALYHARSSHILASACIEQQRNFIQGLLVPSRNRAPCEEGPVVMRSIIVLAGQWDETQQRVRAVEAVRKGIKISKALVGSQVYVVSGDVCSVRELRDQGDYIATERTAWRSRSLRLQDQDTDMILEAALRSLPIDLRDREAVADILMHNELLIIVIGADRASPNYLALKWLCYYAASVLRQSRICVHLETCSVHGVALVRVRSPACKDILAALLSFTRWIRIHKNHAALAEAMLDLIKRKVDVSPSARGLESIQRMHRIIKLCFGDPSSSFMWTFSKRKQAYTKTPMHQELDAIAETIDVDPASKKLTFHNIVRENSADHVIDNKAVGTNIFASVDLCEDRIGKCLLDFFAGRAWVQAAANRWMNVQITARRYYFGILVGNLLTEGLEYVKIGLQIEDSLEDSLTKLIAADSSDFHSRNRLRLLRMVRVLLKPGFAAELGISVVVMEPIDDLHYAILGNGSDKRRACLKDLIHPSKSVVSKCQERLLSLGRTFRAHDSPWELLGMSGANMTDHHIRKTARKHLLQSSSGVLDIFELRLSSPLYGLGVLALPDMSQQEKHQAVHEFFTEDPRCLGYMAARLRETYPTTNEMLEKGPLAMVGFVEAAPIAIDFSERSHGQMRHDLISGGPGCSFADASNRLLCRQVCNEHCNLGGVDPSSVGIAPLMDKAILLPESRRKHHGSNPHLQGIKVPPPLSELFSPGVWSPTCVGKGKATPAGSNFIRGS